MWDERYAESGFAYGTEPNGFLASVAGQIPRGDVLSLGEGEGRNAAFLAGLGHAMTAVDQSEVGLTKARGLAASRGLEIDTRRVDLAEFVISPGAWSGIISIFCHVPPRIRIPLHRQVVSGLKPGGVFVLEAYADGQVGRKTGGPQTTELTMNLADLVEELSGLELLHAIELERGVCEGVYHTGAAAVVQIVARRPLV